jgi:hypothetical protein
VDSRSAHCLSKTIAKGGRWLQIGQTIQNSIGKLSLNLGSAARNRIDGNGQEGSRSVHCLSELIAKGGR